MLWGLALNKRERLCTGRQRQQERDRDGEREREREKQFSVMCAIFHACIHSLYMREFTLMNLVPFEILG